MFQKLGDALRRFMAGRYGSDPLNNALLILGIALIIGFGLRFGCLRLVGTFLHLA